MAKSKKSMEEILASYSWNIAEIMKATGCGHGTAHAVFNEIDEEERQNLYRINKRKVPQYKVLQLMHISRSELLKVYGIRERKG